MIRRIALTVRLPGARTAPVRRTFTCGQTSRETTGAKTPIALLKAIGKESIAILSGEENKGIHCRSILTQIPINGQSRAKLAHTARVPTSALYPVIRYGRIACKDASRFETFAGPWLPPSPCYKL